MDITKSRDGGTGKLVYHANFNTGRFILLNPDEHTDASRYGDDSADDEAPKGSAQPF